MKKLIIFLASAFSLLSSCKKEQESSSFPNITYEVIVDNNHSWFGLYTDKTDAPTVIPDNAPVPSYWKISFKPTTKPFMMYIQVYAKMPPNNNNYPKITINFYIDNKLVKTTTMDNYGIASLQYNIW